MIEIPRHRLEVRTSRSGGPGGQHVNKTETKVEVRFRLEEADWLPWDVRGRLASLFPTRLTKDGDFVVTSERSRSQHDNLEDCLEKLSSMIEAAARPPKKRVKTKPTRASKERRLQAKKKRSERKSWRGKPGS